jgi:hypothetical protein
MQLQWVSEFFIAATLRAASLLADQQDKHPHSNQQGNQNTDDERSNPMPTMASRLIHCRRGAVS